MSKCATSVVHMGTTARTGGWQDVTAECLSWGGRSIETPARVNRKCVSHTEQQLAEPMRQRAPIPRRVEVANVSLDPQPACARSHVSLDATGLPSLSLFPLRSIRKSGDDP